MATEHRTPLEEITLRLDEQTKQRLKRLANSMALSIRAVIEVAINYAYACITEYDLGADDLLTEGLPIGDFPFKIVLALETTEKLKRIEMSQSASECTIIGINLLYDHLEEVPGQGNGQGFDRRGFVPEICQCQAGLW
jgi:hypothetical protein